MGDVFCKEPRKLLAMGGACLVGASATAQSTNDFGMGRYERVLDLVSSRPRRTILRIRRTPTSLSDSFSQITVNVEQLGAVDFVRVIGKSAESVVNESLPDDSDEMIAERIVLDRRSFEVPREKVWGWLDGLGRSLRESVREETVKAEKEARSGRFTWSTDGVSYEIEYTPGIRRFELHVDNESTTAVWAERVYEEVVKLAAARR
jgi:hypothetical protein